MASRPDPKEESHSSSAHSKGGAPPAVGPTADELGSTSVRPRGGAAAIAAGPVDELGSTSVRPRAGAAAVAAGPVDELGSTSVRPRAGAAAVAAGPVDELGSTSVRPQAPLAPVAPEAALDSHSPRPERPHTFAPQQGREEMDSTSLRPKANQTLAPPESNPDLPEGFSIGEYQVTKKLGQGAMGHVFAGVQPVIGKRVAIKVLNRELSCDKGMVQRFIDEARAVNRIAHKNIIDVFSFGQLPDGRQYYVMEFIEGESLGAMMTRQRLSPADALQFLTQICDALAAAHAEGIVHRDLKPDNIYVARPKHGQPYIKVLDFGIAKLLSTDNAANATKTGTPVGTPYYMSPEQVKGLKSVDHRSDLYSLGVIMFEIFTGRVPFLRDTVVEIFLDHINSTPPKPSSLHPLHPRIESIILRCLEKDPANRPQSADELASFLREIRPEELAAQPRPAPAKAPAPVTPAGPPTPTEQAAPPSPTPEPSAPALAAPKAAEPVALTQRAKSKKPLVLAGVAVAAVVSVLVFALMRSPSQQESELSHVLPPTTPHRNGTLRIRTDVPLARFVVDGKDAAQGKTASLNIEGGVPHELRVEVDGEPPKIMQVQVAEGGESEVEVNFSLEARAAPAQAEAVAPPPPPAAPTPKPTAVVAKPKPTTTKTDVKLSPTPTPAKQPDKAPAGRDDTADPFN